MAERFIESIVFPYVSMSPTREKDCGQLAEVRSHSVTGDEAASKLEANYQGSFAIDEDPTAGPSIKIERLSTSLI